MLVYPQLATGALSQFPVRKQRRRRTVVNAAADGTSIKLADPSAQVTEWELKYTGLSGTEVAALQQFFAASEGSLHGFTFLDPTGNLLAWSDHLDNAVWTMESFLSASSGAADPVGGTTAWHLSNSGGGPQSISQTLAAPGGYVYTLSAYAKSSQTTTVTLLLGTARGNRILGPGWSRISLPGTGDPAAASILFGLEVPAGAAIDVYGIQAEPQAAPSIYRSASVGGVYEGARFRDDVLSITADSINSNSTTVNIIHASHL